MIRASVHVVRQTVSAHCSIDILTTASATAAATTTATTNCTRGVGISCFVADAAANDAIMAGNTGTCVGARSCGCHGSCDR